ncbi:MAG: OmpP1/FadL family transporter [Desulfohalobiaceae bacterium]
MKKLIAFVLSSVFLAGSAWAGNVDTYGIGSKATSMGGAFSAYADDPFAAYYNPAGLSQISSPMASGGLMIIDPNLKAKGYKVDDPEYGDLGPTSFHDDSPNLYVPHLGFAMPVNEKWSVGMAAYAPFGLHLEWDENNSNNLSEYPGAYNSYESWYQRMVVTPTAAYQINDKWSLGFGISLGRSEAGHYYQSRGLTTAAGGNPVDIEGEMDDSVNYSANLGVMYKPIDTVTLGLTYRSKTDADFDGDWEIKGARTQLNQYVASQGLPAIENWKYDISMDDVDHPDQVQVGVRYQPHERLSLQADLVWTNWSTVDKQSIKIDDELDPALQTLLASKLNDNNEIVHQRDWEDTRQIRLGIEWQARDVLALRGGYFYDPSPIPDDTFDITWADADKKTYSLGFGWDIAESWVLDGVLQYTTTEQDRDIGGESVNLNDSYSDDAQVSTKAEGEIWGYGLTVSYKF